VNAGATLHRGIEVGVGAELPAGLRADVSWSRARHSYESDAQGLKGNDIESAPRTVATARLGWTPTFAPEGRLSVEWQRVGGYWMDALNQHRYDGHALVNLHATVPVTRSLELVARVNNLADTRYAESAGVTGPATAIREELAPGMPRTVYAGLQLKLGRN
jgi:outer membrane receptor protein involved in Fe transport